MLSIVALCKRSKAAPDEIVGARIIFFRLPAVFELGRVGGGRTGDEPSIGFLARPRFFKFTPPVWWFMSCWATEMAAALATTARTGRLTDEDDGWVPLPSEPLGGGVEEFESVTFPLDISTWKYITHFNNEVRENLFCICLPHSATFIIFVLSCLQVVLLTRIVVLVMPGFEATTETYRLDREPSAFTNTPVAFPHF